MFEWPYLRLSWENQILDQRKLSRNACIINITIPSRLLLAVSLFFIFLKENELLYS